MRHGIVLVAGGAVGAGMFALPIVSAGVGFVWAALGLVSVWFVTYLASVMLLAANLDFPTGASFNTVVKRKLGRAWASANNLSIAFIMYVLMYAYTTAGASILSYTVSPLLAATEQASREMLSLVFILAVGTLVWVGSTSVSRISFLCLTAMAILLMLVVTNLFGFVSLSRLDSSMSQIAFGGMVLPVFVTAFACGGLVPSLVKHYASDAVKVRQCLLYGTLLSLLIYLFWVAATLGVLSQDALIQIVVAGGQHGRPRCGIVGHWRK